MRRSSDQRLKCAPMQEAQIISHSFEERKRKHFRHCVGYFFFCRPAGCVNFERKENTTDEHSTSSTAILLLWPGSQRNEVTQAKRTTSKVIKILKSKFVFFYHILNISDQHAWIKPHKNDHRGERSVAVAFSAWASRMSQLRKLPLTELEGMALLLLRSAMQEES